jgi:hypothetical protein
MCVRERTSKGKNSENQNSDKCLSPSKALSTVLASSKSPATSRTPREAKLRAASLVGLRVKTQSVELGTPEAKRPLSTELPVPPVTPTNKTVSFLVVRVLPNSSSCCIEEEEEEEAVIALWLALRNLTWGKKREAETEKSGLPNFKQNDFTGN